MADDASLTSTVVDTEPTCSVRFAVLVLFNSTATLAKLVDVNPGAEAVSL